MNRHEGLSPQKRDIGISFGLMAVLIPIAAAFLLEEVLFRAPKGVNLRAHHLAGSRSRFKNKENIPIVSEGNTVIIPSDATAGVLVGQRVYFAIDFLGTGARIKHGGEVNKHRSKSGDVNYRMTGGDDINLGKKKTTHTYDDGTVVEWKP